MSHPPTIPVDKKLRIALSVLQGEITAAEAACREKVTEQATGNWNSSSRATPTCNTSAPA